jgi:hypothetical protein
MTISPCSRIARTNPCLKASGDMKCSISWSQASKNTSRRSDIAYLSFKLCQASRVVISHICQIVGDFEVRSALLTCRLHPQRRPRRREAVTRAQVVWRRLTLPLLARWGGVARHSLTARFRRVVFLNGSDAGEFLFGRTHLAAPSSCKNSTRSQRNPC